MEKKIEVRIYEDFQNWLDGLKDLKAQAKIYVKIALIELGNFGNSKSVHKGVTELKISGGPGYRIYYGRKGNKLVFLLAGSQKKDQQKSIEEAQRIWANLKEVT